LLVTSNGAARFALLAAGLEAQAGMKLPTGGFGVIVPEPGGLRLACWGSGPDGGVRALVARAAVSLGGCRGERATRACVRRGFGARGGFRGDPRGAHRRAVLGRSGRAGASARAGRAGETGERVCVDGRWLGDVDPWSVLPGAGLLRAHGDDEWVALARVAGVPVEVLSPGRFGLPGEDGAALDARVAGALGRATWRDPFTGEQTGLLQTIALLGLWRTTLDANRSIAVACGMAWWKRPEIARFLWHPGRPLAFARRPARALAIARKAGGASRSGPRGCRRN
jgi:hypothetical protein